MHDKNYKVKGQRSKVKGFNIIIESVAKSLRPRMIWMNHKPSFASFLHLFIGGGGGGGLPYFFI